MDASLLRELGEHVHPLLRVPEALVAGDVSDPMVTQCCQVLEDERHSATVVHVDAPNRTAVRLPADHNGRIVQPREGLDSRILNAWVEHQDSVHAPIGDPLGMELYLGVNIGRHLEHERVTAFAQHCLNPRDEPGEEYFLTNNMCGAGQHQPHSLGTLSHQRLRRVAWPPVEFLCHCEDARPGCFRDTLLAIDGDRDRAARHAGTLGDICDCHTLSLAPTRANYDRLNL